MLVKVFGQGVLPTAMVALIFHRETNEPVSGIRVTVFTSDGDSIGYLDVLTDSDGQFSIHVPRRSRYILYYYNFLEERSHWPIWEHEITDVVKMVLPF